MISPNDSVQILKNYYMLLFPTYWKGEGMPGTVIDAFSAGVPIIARRWKFCDEMITDGVTGYVYNFAKPDALYTEIDYAISHINSIDPMRNNCLIKANEYSEDSVLNKIIEQLTI